MGASFVEKVAVTGRSTGIGLAMAKELVGDPADPALSVYSATKVAVRSFVAHLGARVPSRVVVSFGLLFAFCAAQGCAPPPLTNRSCPSVTEPQVGLIESVFEFHDSMPTGVTVSSEGRIFVNFPRWGDDVAFTVGEIRGAKVSAYPDVATNTFDPTRPSETFSSVQSVVVDAANRLWILDTGAPNFAPPIAGATKLVAVDLATDKVVKKIVLSAGTATSTPYTNDVRFDLRQGKAGVAYITDSSSRGPGAIIVVDLESGESWRKLEGDPSTSPDSTFVAIVEGEKLAIRAKGKAPVTLAVSADGIATSADGAMLYYSPLSSRHLYSVPTAMLRDRSIDASSVSKSVVDLGEKGASDGLMSDDQGHVYAGDYEHNSIRELQAGGEWHTIAHDSRILWPDTLWVASNHYLYFIANQLNRQALFHDGIDFRAKPYKLFRVKVGGGPVLLK
jgi:sugar lactone lactonase YvrE